LTRSQVKSSLSGKVVALAESRQLDILADLYVRRGAVVRRIPLISIHDHPDQQKVTRWLTGLIADPPEYLIFLTGEGLRRLCTCAARANLQAQLESALQRTCKISRGPKPVRALKEIGLKEDIRAEMPTTDGVIASLGKLDLDGKRVGVQLYGEDPNLKLMEYLRSRNVAEILPVSPYVYGDDSDTSAVVELCRAMAANQIDLVVFTSKPQVRRLFEVSRENNLEAELKKGFSLTPVAAVGPVVADQLREIGVEAQAIPESAYFMKPLVRASEKLFSS